MVNDKMVNNKWLRHIGYGFGDMSSSMFWKVFSYYLPFFYSNIFGLSLKDAGIILLVTRIWDAVSDPMMGIIADRTQTRWGKYRPYLLFVAPLFSIAGILLFTTPDWGYTAKLVWAYATYILMMTVYTGINVPYGAMLGVMTDDSNEKTVYSSFRMFFAYGGSFLALFLWEPLCNAFGGYHSPQGWYWAMVVIAAACFVLFICCFLLTKEELKTVSTVSIGSDFKALLSNKPWWILIGAALCFNLFCTVRGATVAYYFADIIPEGARLVIGPWSFLFYAGLFLAVGEVSNMIGVALCVPIAARLSRSISPSASSPSCSFLFLSRRPASGSCSSLRYLSPCSRESCPRSYGRCTPMCPTMPSRNTKQPPPVSSSPRPPWRRSLAVRSAVQRLCGCWLLVGIILNCQFSILNYLSRIQHSSASDA